MKNLTKICLPFAGLALLQVCADSLEKPGKVIVEQPRAEKLAEELDDAYLASLFGQTCDCHSVLEVCAVGLLNHPTCFSQPGGPQRGYCGFRGFEVPDISTKEVANIDFE